MRLREVSWPTIAALLAALAVATATLSSPDRAFTFYHLWWLPTLGAGLTIFAAWRSHRPRSLLLLLVFLAPLLPLLGLLTACAMGDCL